MKTPTLPGVYDSLRRLCALLLVIIFFTQTALAVRQDKKDAAQPAAESPLLLSPRQGQRGKSYAITIRSRDCTAVKFNVKGNEYDLLKEANSGVTITGDNRGVDGGCTYTAQLTVENDAPIGDIYLKLQSKDGNTLTVPFSINEVAPGPVPPGLDPQVDVMWSLVPHGIVKDNFGRRVGNNFYCVEIVVGNSTGYDLQIASVGFMLGPIGEAATLVAKTRTQIARQLSKTNTIENIISQAPAALEKVKARLKAEGKEGDQAALAAALREEMRNIADSTMAAQTAAVEAAKVQSGLMTELSQQPYPQKLPVSSYRMARGSLEHGQFWDWRNLTVNSLRAFGPFLTGFLPYFRNTSHRANYSEGINILSNPLEKGFELVVPDETVRQLQRLDEQILRDGVIIPNNQQLRTRALIPKKLLQLSGDLRDDPVAVTQALGTLYLIGDKIQYLNRVRVTASPESGEVKPPPTVSAPGSATERTFNQDNGDGESMDLVGTNLEQAQLSSDDPTNVQVTTRAVADRSIKATVKVTAEAEPGPHTVTVSTPSGAVSFPITIIQAEPKVDAEATYDDGQPKYNPTETRSYTISLTGQHLQHATLEAVPNAKNSKSLLVQPDPQSIASDGKSLKAKVTVPADTPAETYLIRVKNRRPPDRYTPPTFKVVVLPQETPVVESVLYGSEEKPAPVVSINPDVDQQPMLITVTGKNLNGATVVIPKALEEQLALKADSLNNQKAESLSVTLLLKKAARGTEYTLQLKNKEGATTPLPVKVNLQPDPQLDIAPPQKIKAGETKDITLTGKNLEGATVVQDTLPAGWKAKEKSASAGQVTITVLAPAGTVPNPYTLELINTSGHKVKFEVEVDAPPAPAPAPQSSPPGL